MAKAKSGGRWPSRQRLEFIDFRLYWEGRINRGDLVDHFGVSVPQASSDLTRYQQAARGNALYDKTLKAYVAGPRFKPAFFEPSADQYLAQLRLIQAGLLPEDEAWAIRPPSYAILPVLRRRLEADTLRRMLVAIRAGESIRVRYQSMTRPAPSWRRIAPHALGFDGARWHARAWCYRREAFRDFVLSRIMEVGESEPSAVEPGDDLGWRREVTLRLAPHPALKGGRRRAVELDYGMVDGVFEVTTRACLAYYCLRQFGLDSEPSEVRPERQQIVLTNRDEVWSVMNETGVCDPSEPGES